MTRTEIDREILRLQRERMSVPVTPRYSSVSRRLNRRITVLRIARAATC